MLVKHSHLQGHIEYDLLKVFIEDLIGSRLQVNIGVQFVLIVENVFRGAVDQALFTNRRLEHLWGIEILQEHLLNTVPHFDQGATECKVFPNKLLCNVGPLNV
jgi:hypothetical protein